MVDGIIDTMITIDLLRNDPRAVSWYGQLRRTRLAITPVVWMETVQGATDAIKRAQMIRFLRQFPVEHPTSDDNLWAMRQIAQFSLSHGAQLQDVMIASVAARLGVPLYTSNLKHYRFLPGVEVVQPY